MTTNKRTLGGLAAALRDCVPGRAQRRRLLAALARVGGNRAISEAIVSSEGWTSLMIAALPPFSSGPQISSVLASKASGARLRKRVSGDRLVKV